MVEKVSCFLTNQSKTKTFIELKVTRRLKPTKNSTRPYLRFLRILLDIDKRLWGHLR